MNYQSYEEDLCGLEMRSLFKEKPSNKVLESDRAIDPSTSPYLKNRLKVFYRCETLDEIIQAIVKDQLCADGFIVTYYSLMEEDPKFKSRRKTCEAIGLRIRGLTCFDNPKVVFGITYYKRMWCFGELEKNSQSWKVHINKPYSYSSSLSINIAKAVVNIAGQGNKSMRLIDPCCGVGTVLLEGFYAGYPMEGWEIKSKVAANACKNLEHFGYEISVTTGDLADISREYDVSIVDLPYGNFSHASREDQNHIIQHALRISAKLVLVVSEDIRERLMKDHIEILDYCKVSKKAIKSFARYVIVCRKKDTHVSKEMNRNESSTV